MKSFKIGTLVQTTQHFDHIYASKKVETDSNTKTDYDIPTLITLEVGSVGIVVNSYKPDKNGLYYYYDILIGGYVAYDWVHYFLKRVM